MFDKENNEISNSIQINEMLVRGMITPVEALTLFIEIDNQKSLLIKRSPKKKTWKK